jgi:hypothetical protein
MCVPDAMAFRVIDYLQWEYGSGKDLQKKRPVGQVTLAQDAEFNISHPCYLHSVCTNMTHTWEGAIQP